MANNDPKATVAQFWALMQANDFCGAGELCSDDFVSIWPVSGERVRGRTNWVAIQEYYPANGRWRFTVQRTVCEGDQVVCDFSVTDGVQQGQSITFFTVNNGQITQMIEYWPEPYEPAGWRVPYTERIE